jgi:putative phage-type endonuclease
LKFTEVEGTDRNTWLKWRHGGIGSSDAAVIMGVSRFKTRDQLLIEKATGFTGEDQSNAYIKDRGNKIEVQVREFLEKEYCQSFAPMSCYMTNFTFLRCSLDGATQDRKTITEIKLLSVFNPAKPNKEAAGYKKWELAQQGSIPEEYYPQIQHQLMITGADVCVFLGYKEVKGDLTVTNDKLARILVVPNEEYIHMLIRKEFEFWVDVEYLRDKIDKGGLE